MATAHDAAHTLVGKTASAATYGGSSAALVFGLTANEFAAVAGVVIALVGLFVNIWFKHQHLKLVKAKMQSEQIPDHE